MNSSQAHPMLRPPVFKNIKPIFHGDNQLKTVIKCPEQRSQQAATSLGLNGFQSTQNDDISFACEGLYFPPPPPPLPQEADVVPFIERHSQKSQGYYNEVDNRSTEDNLSSWFIPAVKGDDYQAPVDWQEEEPFEHYQPVQSKARKTQSKLEFEALPIYREKSILGRSHGRHDIQVLATQESQNYQDAEILLPAQSLNSMTKDFQRHFDQQNTGLKPQQINSQPITLGEEQAKVVGAPSQHFDPHHHLNNFLTNQFDAHNESYSIDRYTEIAPHQFIPVSGYAEDQQHQQRPFREHDNIQQDLYEPIERYPVTQHEQHKPFERQDDYQKHPYRPTEVHAEYQQRPYGPTEVHAEYQQRPYGPTEVHAEYQQRPYGPTEVHAEYQQRPYEPTEVHAEYQQRSYGPTEVHAEYKQHSYGPHEVHAEYQQRPYGPIEVHAEYQNRSNVPAEVRVKNPQLQTIPRHSRDENGNHKPSLITRAEKKASNATLHKRSSNFEINSKQTQIHTGPVARLKSPLKTDPNHLVLGKESQANISQQIMHQKEARNSQDPNKQMQRHSTQQQINQLAKMLTETTSSPRKNSRLSMLSKNNETDHSEVKQSERRRTSSRKIQEIAKHIDRKLSLRDSKSKEIMQCSKTSLQSTFGHEPNNQLQMAPTEVLTTTKLEYHKSESDIKGSQETIPGTERELEIAQEEEEKEKKEQEQEQEEEESCDEPSTRRKKKKSKAKKVKGKPKKAKAPKKVERPIILYPRKSFIPPRVNDYRLIKLKDGDKNVNCLSNLPANHKGSSESLSGEQKSSNKYKLHINKKKETNEKLEATDSE
ncbi:hypothetical protein CAPTEDRAFT_206001 [Capitella teleta]|uniref:Uncharacterized protein n=1 Tax=Capitella teleta TaxID=283909 RepID=R7U3G5_CAPTE|nr:hypothetical protein CAPTEDRAFT_206001 [Capitella teleta]|eukprot:ELU00671.1 hypothetical protein CAPTEDRAFT_206001 [Capitella teleta]